MIPKLTKLNHKLNLEGKLQIYLSDYTKTSENGVAGLKQIFEYSFDDQDTSFEDNLPFVGITQPREGKFSQFRRFVLSEQEEKYDVTSFV